MAYVGLFLLLPKTLSRTDFRLIVVGAILFRAIGFVGAPIYENDYFRYLWDGRTFAVTGSPYGKAPAESFGDDTLAAPFPEILSQINYPDIPTIYGPVTELSFLLAYYVSPGALWPLKLFYIAADLATLWLLANLMPFSRNLLLYAWSPLLIKEVAFTAHPDVLAAACMVAAALALQSGRNIAGGLALRIGRLCAFECGRPGASIPEEKQQDSVGGRCTCHERIIRAVPFARSRRPRRTGHVFERMGVQQFRIRTACRSRRKFRGKSGLRSAVFIFLFVGVVAASGSAAPGHCAGRFLLAGARRESLVPDFAGAFCGAAAFRLRYSSHAECAA